MSRDGGTHPARPWENVRTVDNTAIRSHGAVRFRSEYHYAVFEYWRSAKLLRYLERAGVTRLGRVLDDGCGSGGMTVSIAEEAHFAVGIEPTERVVGAGPKLAVERRVQNLQFVRADGHDLPFEDRSFDLALSHAVIEHVADPPRYLRELKRVLKPGGLLFLQTAPYLSPSGAHLPRLKWPIPYYLPLGRRAAFSFARWLGKHAPHYLDTPAEGSSFVTMAKRGERKEDDLLYRVTLRRLRRDIAGAGFTSVREDLQISRLARRLLPSPTVGLLPRIPLLRDVVVVNMEYLLAA